MDMFEDFLTEYNEKYLNLELNRKVSWTEKIFFLILIIPWYCFALISNWFLTKSSIISFIVYIISFVLLVLITSGISECKVENIWRFSDKSDKDKWQLEILNLLRSYQWEEIPKIDCLIEKCHSIAEIKSPTTVIIEKIERLISLYLLAFIFANYNNTSLFKNIIILLLVGLLDFIVFPSIEKKSNNRRELIKQLCFDLQQLKCKIILEGKINFLNSEKNNEQNKSKETTKRTENEARKLYKKLDRTLRKIRFSWKYNTYNTIKESRHSINKFYQENALSENCLSIRLRELHKKKEEKILFEIPIFISILYSGANLFLGIIFNGNIFKGIILRLFKVDSLYTIENDSYRLLEAANKIPLLPYLASIFFMLLLVVITYVAVYMIIKGLGPELAFHKDRQLKYEIDYLENTIKEKMDRDTNNKRENESMKKTHK